LRHQSVTVRWGICKMAATCSGVRTSVGVIRTVSRTFRPTSSAYRYMYLGL
jgi:hypothetical protein